MQQARISWVNNDPPAPLTPKAKAIAKRSKKLAVHPAKRTAKHHAKQWQPGPKRPPLYPTYNPQPIWVGPDYATRRPARRTITLSNAFTTTRQASGRTRQSRIHAVDPPAHQTMTMPPTRAHCASATDRARSAGPMRASGFLLVHLAADFGRGAMRAWRGSPGTLGRHPLRKRA